MNGKLKLLHRRCKQYYTRGQNRGDYGISSSKVLWQIVVFGPDCLGGTLNLTFFCWSVSPITAGRAHGRGREGGYLPSAANSSTEGGREKENCDKLCVCPSSSPHINAKRCGVQGGVVVGIDVSELGGPHFKLPKMRTRTST